MLPPQLCSPQTRLTSKSPCITYGIDTIMGTRVDKTRSYQLYLSAGVSHVADDAAILHSVQMFSPHNVFIAFKETEVKEHTIALLYCFVVIRANSAYLCR